MSPSDTPSSSAARLRELANSLGFLLEDDIRCLYGITESTAESWRKRGTGPRHFMAGNVVLYSRDAVVKDLASRIRERAQVTGKGAL